MPSKNNKPVAFLSAAELMPSQTAATRILRERANHLAIHEHDKTEKAGFISYIQFRLNANERYGIPYHYIKEVIQPSPPTKIPFVPDFIAGAINHRGALLAVFDLKKILHIQSPTVERGHIILITHRSNTLGFLVDGIDGSSAYEPATLDAALTSDDVTKPDYILGLHQGITAIINVEAMLSDPQLQVAK